MGLSENIIFELRRRRGKGIAQSEMESLFGFSRSHVSETISKLEKSGKIISRNDENNLRRIWLTEFFPYYMDNVLRIGFLKSSEYIPFISTAADIAELYGISLLMEDYSDAMLMMDDLNDGLIEIALAPFFTQMLYSVSNSNVKITGAVSSGGSCVIENQDATNDICASTESSSMMLIMREFLKKTGDRKVKNFRDPGRALGMFRESRIRFLAIWEPYLSKAGGKIAMNYGEAMDSFPCCTVALKKEMTEKKIIEAIMSRYLKGSEVVIDQNVLIKFSKITRIDVETIRRSLESYNFSPKFDYETVKNYLKFTGMMLSDDKLKSIFSFRYYGMK
ncbi:MAG: hypothetical protein ACP5UV_03880 [Thermoplasmata archaeon]